MLRSNTSVLTSRACLRISKRYSFSSRRQLPLTLPSLLQELDEDLMLELDEIVRQNQLACLPIAKSGRAEAELVERYPKLLNLMERGKRIKIDSMSLQRRIREREAKSVGGSKAKAAFLEDFDQSPLMFDMEADSESDTERTRKSKSIRRHSPRSAADDNLLPPSSLPIDDDVWDRRQQVSSSRANDAIAASASPSSYKSRGMGVGEPTPLNSKIPWGPPTMTASKIDMKDIMAQASPTRVSNLSAGLSLRDKENDAPFTGSPAKLSQRERKKQQQQKQISQSLDKADVPSPALAEKQNQDKNPSSPWQIAAKGSKISLKDVLGAESSKSPPSPKGSIARTTSPLTLRQTVSGKTPSTRRAITGPAPTLAPTQKRSISTPDSSKFTSGQTPPHPSRSSSNHPPTPIQSSRHTTPPIEPSLQLSMADILSQQQTEKDVIKEAAAKRSLQEIQEEQAFQEWWDEESRKVKAEEEEVRKPAARGGRDARGKIRGRGALRGRGRGRGRGGGEVGEGSSTKDRGGKKAADTGPRGRGH